MAEECIVVDWPEEARKSFFWAAPAKVPYAVALEALVVELVSTQD